ncbi:MGMT family protein [Propioniciclava sp.]|uniref:MGMT family protein n=1 Tax=Propioniciclava sp. TaxID=2038686 RepID=UPI00261E18D5|nr:MGMT family protein [Propioniciclava sp.]
MTPDAVDRVLLAVVMIPPGRVASYGDIGALVGVGPRRVGSIMARQGDGVPWWRVLGASGVSPVLDAALPHWRREGIAVRRDGRGCRMADYRADPHQLAADYAFAAAERGRPQPTG